MAVHVFWSTLITIHFKISAFSPFSKIELQPSNLPDARQVNNRVKNALFFLSIFYRLSSDSSAGSPSQKKSCTPTNLTSCWQLCQEQINLVIANKYVRLPLTFHFRIASSLSLRPSAVYIHGQVRTCLSSSTCLSIRPVIWENKAAVGIPEGSPKTTSPDGFHSAQGC